MKTTFRLLFAIIAGLMVVSPLDSRADTFIANPVADTSLSATVPSTNFGGAGLLAIAAPGLPKGEFDAVLRFNLSGAISQFDTNFGVGNWQITGLTLKFASSFGTNGAVPSNNNLNTVNEGSFGIDWLANDIWIEGNGNGNGTMGYPTNNNTSYNSISNLFSAGSDSLGTFYYTPPGNNVYTNYDLPLITSLVSDASAGGNVTLYFYAADSQVSYLFNSRSGANPPQLVVTAVPEPATMALISVAIGGLLFSRRRR